MEWKSNKQINFSAAQSWARTKREIDRETGLLTGDHRIGRKSLQERLRQKETPCSNFFPLRNNDPSRAHRHAMLNSRAVVIMAH